MMVPGQHQGAGRHSDEADREDSAQVARDLVCLGLGRRGEEEDQIKHPVIVVT